MARSAVNRVPKETPTRTTTTSRRPRSVPKTKPDGEDRQLEVEEQDEGPGETEELPETDSSEATPPEPKKRGRKPGAKATKPASSNSKLHQLVSLAESVIAFGTEHETHPVEVLNSIEALLKATGEIDQ